MPRPILLYVRGVDALSRVVGRCVLYLIFVMMGILLYSSVARSAFNSPPLWANEMSQFTLASYYLLGGAYAMLLHGHVRMDLLYSRWSPKGQAVVDAITIFFLIFYLVFLLVGGISSTHYALEYNQKNYSSWAPPLAPIKIIMCIGIGLMLLQAISTFFKDIARARGTPINEL